MKHKIQNLINLGSAIDEDQTRSLMVLIRKNIELMDETETSNYLTLNLFCNWSVHPEITRSMMGLRTLVKINDALVRVRSSTVINVIQSEISDAVGFHTLRNELILFLNNLGISNNISRDEEWSVILKRLIDIIKDVPIAFPPLGDLNNQQRSIYNKIANNPIKTDAGVIMAQLSSIDYGKFGIPNGGEFMCVLMRMEDTTTIVVPLIKVN